MTTRGKRLEAELAVGFPVLFEILPGIFEPDFVLLQKAIEFVARDSKHNSRRSWEVEILRSR